jgi:GAF domain-containing protein
VPDAASADPSGGRGLESLDPAVAQVARETGAHVSAVYLLPAGRQVLRLALLSGVSWQIAAPWARVDVEATTPVSDAVRERRLLWVGDQEELARRYPQLALVLPYPFALAAAPITSDTTIWGGLVLHWPPAPTPRLSPRQRQMIIDACGRLGALLQQAADDGRPVLAGPEPRVLPPDPSPSAESAQSGTRASVQFAERLPGGCCALDLDGRITFVTATAADLVGAEASDLLGALPPQALPWLGDPVFKDRYRAAVLSRQPTSFTALRPPDRWLSFHLYPDASGISVRIAPAASIPTPATAKVLHPAPPVAPSRARDLYHLMHLAVTLTEAVGVQDVVDRVADHVLPAAGARAMALMTAEEGRLRVIGYRGYAAELMDRVDGVPLTSDTPAVQVLNTGVPDFFASSAELQRAYPRALLRDGMAAWVFLPLITSGRPVGSLVLAYDRPQPFGAEERGGLISIAGLIAQALDRALLYDAKHHLAQNLQAGLLPQTLPRIPGLEVAARYLPAGHGVGIGGDFYDLIRLDVTTAAAAIGDVQGHNVHAAVLMGQVRTAVHATAGAPPGEVLARTNRLLNDLDPGLFTSCLYAHLDLARHTACLATAGHPPPLLRHPDGHTEVLHVPPGLLLGIDPGADYPTTEITLPPGSVLALYTDGLVEAVGIDLDDATQDLADQLTRAERHTMDDLADTLIQHARQSAPRCDDIALFLIHRR